MHKTSRDPQGVLGTRSVLWLLSGSTHTDVAPEETHRVVAISFVYFSAGYTSIKALLKTMGKPSEVYQVNITTFPKGTKVGVGQGYWMGQLGRIKVFFLPN